MSPRVAAFYCVFDDDEWLPFSLASIYPCMEKIYFFVSHRPWNGPVTDNSTTLRVIEEFPDPDNKIELIRGEWTNEVQQRNAAMAHITIKGFDYAFIIDADEIYHPDALRNMLALAASRPEVEVWHCWFIHFWKSSGYRIDPPENHHPPILLKPGCGGFLEYRNCVANKHELIPAEIGFCFHMSYARTDEQIRRKLTAFSHSHQVAPDWFDRVWKGWDNDHSITDLCPYNPGVFERAVAVDPQLLPPVLQEPQRSEYQRMVERL